MTRPNWRQSRLDTSADRPLIEPSCPAVCRAAKSCLQRVSKQDVDVRDKPGHDVVETHCLSAVMPGFLPGIHVFYFEISGQFRQRGGIRIRSSSWALVSSVAVNFKSTASFTIVSSPVILSGSTAARGKNSSRVRLALASLMLSQSA